MPSSPLDTLSCDVGLVASARSPAEVLERLLEGIRPRAPRAVLLLLREGWWRGWGAVGYAPDAERRLLGTTVRADAAWVESLGAEGEPTIRPATPDVLPVDLGEARDDESAGFPLRVSGRLVGWLHAERHPEEGPWEPSALAVLVATASLRLEIDMLRRRSRGGEPSAQPAGRFEFFSTVPAPPDPTRSGNGSAESSLAPWLQEAAPFQAQAELEAARRFARLLATDIRLYHEDAVMVGRRQRDLAQRLRVAIEKANDTLRRRFPRLGRATREVMREACVQVLAGGDESLLAGAGPDGSRDTEQP